MAGSWRYPGLDLRDSNFSLPVILPANTVALGARQENAVRKFVLALTVRRARQIPMHSPQGGGARHVEDECSEQREAGEKCRHRSCVPAEHEGDGHFASRDVTRYHANVTFEVSPNVSAERPADGQAPVTEWLAAAVMPRRELPLSEEGSSAYACPNLRGRPPRARELRKQLRRQSTGRD